ncbi:molybdopterin-dependent oxidoreductase [Parafrankia discariae]|uniref:molybdopterin-dependent oxidoreductase n=1 Tax=Parafrankia discariae TaxID=365528 RepID=UPI003898F513
MGSYCATCSALNPSLIRLVTAATAAARGIGAGRARSVREPTEVRWPSVNQRLSKPRANVQMSPHPLRRVRTPRFTALFAVPALLIAGAVASLPGTAAEAAGPTPSTQTAARPPAGHHPPVPAKTYFFVKGKVAHPARLTVADLARYPQSTQQVTFQSGAGPQTHTYTGARLIDVLTAAGPAFRADVKNDLLRYAVLVRASDGYEAVLSWPELVDGYGGTQALLASTEDGASLAEQGPRLTVPDDAKGGRYVSGVTSITLVRVGA